jgi:hypothetical protein
MGQITIEILNGWFIVCETPLGVKHPRRGKPAFILNGLVLQVHKGRSSSRVLYNTVPDQTVLVLDNLWQTIQFQGISFFFISLSSIIFSKYCFKSDTNWSSVHSFYVQNILRSRHKQYSKTIQFLVAKTIIVTL